MDHVFSHYIVLPSYKGRYDYYSFNWLKDSSDPYDCARVRSYDHLLHRTLSKIFRERRLTSSQIRRLVRAPRKHSKEESIFKLILEREPKLGKLLLKRSKLSLLWIAVLSCYQTSAELLVRCGADVHELFEMDSYLQIINSCTFLHALLEMYPSSWNERFIGVLIDHGINIKAQDPRSFNRTALHIAAMRGRVKVAETLLKKGADVNARDGDLDTPLLTAASSEEADKLVPLLLKHGADITVRSNNSWNVLYYLAVSPCRDNFDLAKDFIEMGVSPREVMDSVQYQPIHAAVLRENNKLVNLFLNHGANVNAKAFGDIHPLYIATQDCEDLAVLQTLLKRGANIDLTNRRGKTVLHSLKFGKKHTQKKLKLLLSVGADMFSEASDRVTPFEIACGKDPNSAKVMLKTLALRKACLKPSIQFRDERIIEQNFATLVNSYQFYINEINKIKSFKFIKKGPLFELLTKCQCQVVALMRNLEFKNQFKNYHKAFLRLFPVYAEDIIEAFERADNYYKSTVLELENLFDEAVYNTLPHIVARKVVRYTLTCEVCEMKKTTMKINRTEQRSFQI